jgi:hypothetical protein
MPEVPEVDWFVEPPVVVELKWTPVLDPPPVEPVGLLVLPVVL